MAREPKTVKQSADKDSTETEREGFSADELGAASIYNDPTEIAQQMRRGDETEGDADARDHTGATRAEDTPQGRQDRDTRRTTRTPQE